MARLRALVFGGLGMLLASCATHPDTPEPAMPELARPNERRDDDSPGRELLFVLKRTGGIAGATREAKFYATNNDAFLKEFQSIVDSCLKDHYPAPPSADTFDYQLITGDRTISWNELSPDVPRGLHDLEGWLGKF